MIYSHRIQYGWVPHRNTVDHGQYLLCIALAKSSKIGVKLVRKPPIHDLDVDVLRPTMVNKRVALPTIPLRDAQIRPVRGFVARCAVQLPVHKGFYHIRLHIVLLLPVHAYLL